MLRHEWAVDWVEYTYVSKKCRWDEKPGDLRGWHLTWGALAPTLRILLFLLYHSSILFICWYSIDILYGWVYWNKTVSPSVTLVISTTPTESGKANIANIAQHSQQTNTGQEHRKMPFQLITWLASYTVQQIHGYTNSLANTLPTPMHGSLLYQISLHTAPYF